MQKPHRKALFVRALLGMLMILGICSCQTYPPFPYPPEPARKPHTGPYPGYYRGGGYYGHRQGIDNRIRWGGGYKPHGTSYYRYAESAQ